MKRKKEENTSAKAPKKRNKPANKGRLTSMLESMQERSSPVNAHKVATKYFEDFRKERSIPARAKVDAEKEEKTTAVSTGIDSALSDSEHGKDNTAVTSKVDSAVSNDVNTAVDIQVADKPKKPSPYRAKNKRNDLEILSDSLSSSEMKVYYYMKETCSEKKTDKLRFGLKELKENTGLSDKTVRVVIHSLVQKLNIEVVQPSMGIYGRMILVNEPEVVLRRREKAGMTIDQTTKKITSVDTAVNSTVRNTVNKPVSSAVKEQDIKKKEIASIYSKYTNNKWDEKAEIFYKSISDMDINIVEAAIILGTLKDKKRNKHLTEFKELLSDIQSTITKAQIEHLRDIWNQAKLQ